METMRTMNGDVPDRDALEDGERVSVIALFNVLTRHSWIVVGLPILAVVLILTWRWMEPEEYRADAAVMPQGGTNRVSRLSGIAQQFGINVGESSRGSEGVEFYAELMKSRTILDEIAGDSLRIEEEGESSVSRIDLGKFFRIEAPTPEKRQRAIRSILEEKISANPDPLTGIIELSVRSREPEISEAIARRLIELTADFNLERRQSAARAEREFLESRLTETREDLRNAEHELERFLQQNRSYESSPELLFEARRLQRDVDFHQQLVTSVATAFEEARIEEIRTTPVLTVLEAPENSATNVRSSLLLSLLMGGILGLVAGIAISFGIEYLRSDVEKNPNDVNELMQRWTKLRSRLVSGTNR